MANRRKLEPVTPIGLLDGKDSAVLTALTIAVEQFQMDTALEIAEASFDAIALTLLTAHDRGLPEGAQVPNPNMQRVMELLAEAGRRERETDR